jgi:hypothetical protein
MPEQVFGAARVSKLQNTARSIAQWRVGASAAVPVPVASAPPSVNGTNSDATSTLANGSTTANLIPLDAL